jgi:hypothetical protein
MTDAASAYQHFKLVVTAATGLSRDALHVYAGMAVLLLVAGALRRPLQSILPWLVVMLVAVVAELPDLRDDLAQYGRWHWLASVHDVVNTLFWPTVLLFFTRWRYGPG